MDAIPLFGGAFEQQLAVLQAGIVHEQPGRSVAGDDLAASAHDRCLVRELDLDGSGAMAVFGQLLDFALRTGSIAIRDHDHRTGLGQDRSDARADSAGASGDERHSAIESERGHRASIIGGRSE